MAGGGTAAPGGRVVVRRQRHQRARDHRGGAGRALQPPAGPEPRVRAADRAARCPGPCSLRTTPAALRAQADRLRALADLDAVDWPCPLATAGQRSTTARSSSPPTARACSTVAHRWRAASGRPLWSPVGGQGGSLRSCSPVRARSGPAWAASCTPLPGVRRRARRGVPASTRPRPGRCGSPTRRRWPHRASPSPRCSRSRWRCSGSPSRSGSGRTTSSATPSARSPRRTWRASCPWRTRARWLPRGHA